MKLNHEKLSDKELRRTFIMYNQCISISMGRVQFDYFETVYQVFMNHAYCQYCCCTVQYRTTSLQAAIVAHHCTDSVVAYYCCCIIESASNTLLLCHSLPYCTALRSPRCVCCSAACSGSLLLLYHINDGISYV